MEKNAKSIPILDAYLKDLQESFNRLKAQMSPALDVQETMQKYFQQLIQQITEAQNSFQKDLELYSEQWQKLSEQLQQRFNELPLLTQEALLLLGKHGWYLDLEMTDEYLWWLTDNFAKGNETKAENALVGYFEGRLSEIETSITKRFPHRGHLIKAAFSAHQRQEFELSIPVLLAQTDGICKEVVNQYLFRKTNGKPLTAIYVEQIIADTYDAALLSPLAKTLPINASEKERPTDSSALNRHTVLHGESLDYGSKINSLKAISLINYVTHVLEVEKKSPLK